ncbi:hypothetical protein [Streptomyces sp. NPDC020571]|uniref:hypothetical protein n=1 Tax=Streptomyces sp. NPDC020571 TaxID=3365079 RepID=UPI0037A2BBF1
MLAVVLQHASLGAHGASALADAFDRAFWWSVALTALAVPLCLLLPGRPGPRPSAEKTRTGTAVEA